jgi:hypothetical protein
MTERLKRGMKPPMRALSSLLAAVACENGFEKGRLWCQT